MRTVVVSGSASGLGAETRRQLEAEGQRVIGIDLRGAEIETDLGTPAGRAQAVAASLAACGGRLDGLVSCAGIGPDGEARAIARVDYFGALALLDGLRDALARGEAPAAVAISSMGGAVHALERPEFLAACHAGDEERAQALIEGCDGNTAYSNAKRAFAQAVRRRAPEWGRLGVRLNAVLPGKMETPMLARLEADPTLAASLRMLPVPLGRAGAVREIASSVLFLLGAQSSYVHGALLFVDGGSHAQFYPEQV